MRIVHIDPRVAYNEGWGYHDNLLPEYQRKLGHEVSVIVSTKMFKNGALAESEPCDYQLPDGRRIIRLKRKKYSSAIFTNLCYRLEVYELLKELKPDLIFNHGLLSTTDFDIVKYKKKINPECVIFKDSHIDYYNNGNKSAGLKGKIIKEFYIWLNRVNIGHVSKVYGVTPWRKQFAEEYFKIPAEKTAVSIMGADDDKIAFDKRDEIKSRIRDELSLSESDFVIATGGKIDKTKNIHLLAQAVSELKDKNVKLIIFGETVAEFEAEMKKLLENSQIKMIGWLEADRVYDYFLASDAAFFPGTHSVLWEQACACGIPLFFKDWGEGMHHVFVNGNCEFLHKDSVAEIKEKILELLENPEKYNAMKTAAEGCREEFFYSRIAKAVIDDYYAVKEGKK